MENPKCPYCGDEMEYYWDNNPMMPYGFYYCVTCGCRAPSASTQAIARAAAMDRFPEGRWEWNDDNGYYYCSECGAVSPREDQDGEYIDCPHYCHNCGAEMREEEDDE